MDDLSALLESSKEEGLTVREYVAKYGLTNAESGYVKPKTDKEDSVYEVTAMRRNYSGYDPTKYTVGSDNEDITNVAEELDEYGQIKKLEIEDLDESSPDSIRELKVTDTVADDKFGVKSELDRAIESENAHNKPYKGPRKLLTMDGLEEDEVYIQSNKHKATSISAKQIVGDGSLDLEVDVEEVNMGKVSLLGSIKLVISEALNIIKNPLLLVDSVSKVNTNSIGVNLNSSEKYINMVNAIPLLVRAESYWFIVYIIVSLLSVLFGGRDVFSEVLFLVISLLVLGFMAYVFKFKGNIWKTLSYKVFASLFIILAVLNIFTVGIALLSTVLYSLFEGIGFLISRLVTLGLDVLGWVIVAGALSEAVIPSEDYDN